MTEEQIQAIRKTRQIWVFMRDNPDLRHKTLAYTKLGLSPDRFDCPCCEYAYRRKPADSKIFPCHLCPLKNQWQQYSLCDTFTCEGRLSPYYLWNVSKTTIQRAYYAAEIIHLCDQALKEIS